MQNIFTIWHKLFVTRVCASRIIECIRLINNILGKDKNTVQTRLTSLTAYLPEKTIPD